MPPFGQSRSMLCAIGAAAIAALLAALWLAGSGDGLASAARGRAPLRPATLGGARSSRGARFLPSRSSRFSSTYARPDGSMMTRISTSPLNVRDRTGRWQPIDSALVARADGFSDRSGVGAVDVPRRLSRGVHVHARNARLAMRLANADAVASVRGSRATYAGALPGVSVVYDATTSAVREKLVLTDTTAPHKFTFALRASRGLRARMDRAGNVVFSRRGHAVFALPASVAFAQGNPSRRRPVPSVLRRTGADWTLTLTPSRQWVERQLVKGPVVVDPTIEIDPDSQDCFIESDTPTTTYCSDPNVSVGYDGANDQRGLVQFDLSAIPSGAVVLNADLGLTLGWHSTNNTKQVGVYQVVRNWTNSATWNGYDATSSWATAGAAGSADASSVPADIKTIGNASGFVDWYPTRLVQGWVDGSIPNHGVLIRDVNPNTTANEMNFSSADAGGSTPELDIVWAPRTGRLDSYRFDTQQLTDRSRVEVNVANGNLLVSGEDVRALGTGLDLELSHYHNSLGTDFGLQGAGIPGTLSLGRDVKLTPFSEARSPSTGETAWSCRSLTALSRVRPRPLARRRTSTRR
jgi:hypothetical protein